MIQYGSSQMSLEFSILMTLKLTMELPTVEQVCDFLNHHSKDETLLRTLPKDMLAKLFEYVRAATIRETWDVRIPGDVLTVREQHEAMLQYVEDHEMKVIKCKGCGKVKVIDDDSVTCYICKANYCDDCGTRVNIKACSYAACLVRNYWCVEHVHHLDSCTICYPNRYLAERMSKVNVLVGRMARSERYGEVHEAMIELGRECASLRVEVCQSGLHSDFDQRFDELYAKYQMLYKQIK